MNNNAEKPLVVERTYDAPPEAIWQAITDPEQMKQWYFDLPGFRAEVGYKFQFEGGPAPEKQYLHLCEVTEVEPNSRLTYSWRYDGYEGNSFVTFDLFPKEGKTLLRLTHEGLHTFPASNPDLAVSNFEAGWTDILGTYLTDFLEKQPTLILTRSLDAPRELVFKAWTEPEHLAKWWGPAGMEIRVLRFDLRPGGIFHYAMQPKNGAEMYGRMAYREIAAPERIVWVNSFADAAGNVAQSPYFAANQFPLEIHNVLTLSEQAGKTILTIRGRPINAGEGEVEFYKSMFPSMEKGFGGTFEQLAEYLKTL